MRNYTTMYVVLAVVLIFGLFVLTFRQGAEATQGPTLLFQVTCSEFACVKWDPVTGESWALNTTSVPKDWNWEYVEEKNRRK